MANHPSLTAKFKRADLSVGFLLSGKYTAYANEGLMLFAELASVLDSVMLSKAAGE